MPAARRVLCLIAVTLCQHFLFSVEAIVTRIGPLTIDFNEKTVLHDGVVQPLGMRAFALLTALFDEQGSVVSKNSLIAKVWPDADVEENNLQVNILALRRVLGPYRHLIRTISGRGYMLTRLESPAPPSPTESARKIQNTGRLFGRGNDLKRISEMLSASQIVSLVGPGGVGKTSLALQFCDETDNPYRDGTRFVSLALVADDRGARATIAKAFHDLPDSSAVSFQHVTERLASAHTLLVLDNCEHLLDEIASIATELTRACPFLRILLTSRSALGIDGELVFPVPALDTADKGASCEAILRSQSAQLFLHRVRRASGKQPEDDASVQTIGEICRRLDGIPLAIELAAARSAVFGLTTVANLLDDRFNILTGGSRNVLPRHQTLRAVFDWSFALLSKSEQRLFLQCGVFAGGISLDAAAYVMKRLGHTREATIDAIAGLVSKSLLVSAQRSGQHFHLLESTRAYALEQLEQSGTTADARRAHAEYFMFFFEQMRASKNASLEVRLDKVSSELENVRTALNWCFDNDSAEYLGVELTCEAAPLLFDLSLLEECSLWARIAIQRIDQTSLQAYLPRTKLKLLSAFASSLVYSEAPGKDVQEAWEQARSLAATYGDSDRELRAVWGLWNNQQYQGDCLKALALARRFADLASTKGTQLQIALSHRVMGIALHYVGAHEPAQEELRAALSYGLLQTERWVTTGVRVDQTAVTKATLARAYWFSGNTALGMQMAAEAETLARNSGHEMTIAYVLVESTIPLSLLSNDAERALRAVHELRAQARRAGLNIYLNCCDAFEYAANSSAAATDPGFMPRFSATVERMADSNYGAAYPLILLMFARAYVLAGDTTESAQILETAAEYCKRRGSRWLLNEFATMRVQLNEHAAVHR